MTSIGMTKRTIACLLTCVLLLGCIGAQASNVPVKVIASKATLYEKASAFSAKIKTFSKGQTLTVTGVKGMWVRATSNSLKGYMLRSAVQKTNESGDKDSVTTAEVVAKLKDLGYLKGSSSGAIKRGLRIFQMMNSLTVNGNLNDETQGRLFGNSARKKPAISHDTWGQSDINSTFRRRGVAVMIDMATGARMHIRRVGGTEHCDVEPKTAADTATLKRVYGGTFSWDSRGVLLIANGHCYPAAINSMPHGDQISHANNYDGQFCLHLRGSKTHGSDTKNEYHQKNIEKVYKYLTA